MDVVEQSNGGRDPQAPSSPLARRAFAFGLLGLAYLALVLRFDFVTDDAFISFRYSQNLARGLGLRYNVGVEPPVEGFSNFLWVVWLAIFEGLRWDVTLWARLSSVACGAFLLWRCFRLLERRLGSLQLAGLGALLLATLPPFAAWSTSGLATMPFALALFLGFEALLGDASRPRAAAGALALAAVVLLRTDGPYWVMLVAASAGIVWLATRSRALLRATVVACAVAAAVFGLYVAFRHAYFGDWVSNTARAKVGFSATRLERGFNYDAIFLLTYLSVPAALLLALPRLRRRGEEEGELPALVRACFLMVGGTLLFALLVGGDFFCMGRFLVPALPFVVIAGTVALTGLGRGALPAAVGLVLLSLLPGWDLHLVPESWRARFHFRWRTDEYMSEHARWLEQDSNSAAWTDLGRALRLHSAPGDSFVFGRIGAVGYYSGLVIHDRKGLVDREVALKIPSNPDSSPGHEKLARLSFFRKRRPTFVYAEIRSEEEAGPKDLWEAYRFRVGGDEREMALLRDYRYEAVPLAEEDGFAPGQVLCRYRRKQPAP